MTNDSFRLMDYKDQNNTSSSANNEVTAAKLAVFGGLLSTLGDGISTIAAVLALEELQDAQNNTNDKISELEKRITYLTKEMDQQKKRR